MDSLKHSTARSLKWNLIDRFGSQVLYAVTGIVLARVLTQEDFGLVGAVMVFQSFALLLIDSGFSYALIQRKEPTRLDYSTVLWFNLIVAVVIYAVLWSCAPAIDRWFDGGGRLVPLSRVMFLSFVVNASSIVQANRLMKRMDVKPLAIANCAGLVIGAVVGIWLALKGFGAWAIVWQTIASGAVKSAWLWVGERWTPMWQLSWRSLRSFAGIGGSMMATSALNTLFLNIYSFFIGNRAGLVPLGYYTQSDKWSKMGVATLSQVLTSSFLPVLSAVQDDAERLRRVVRKMHRFTAYATLPVLVGLMVLAQPIFHVLFGEKWDASIILFQMLLARGVFTVFISLYNNYILAMGRSRLIVAMEVLRDSLALIALVATLPWIAVSTPDNVVWGITVLLWGQIAASAITWVATLVVASRAVGVGVWALMADLGPYVALTAVTVPLMWLAGRWIEADWLQLGVEAVVGISVYAGLNALLNSAIQRDVVRFVRGGKFEMR